MTTLKEAYDAAVARCVTVSTVVLKEPAICSGCDATIRPGRRATKLLEAGIYGWWCAPCSDRDGIA